MDFMKKKKAQEENKITQDEDDRIFECLEIQIKRLAIFYLAFALIDLILLGIGNIVDYKERYAFECLHDWYFLTT